MSDGAILPVVRYADPKAAAEWLRKAYGFIVYHTAKRPDGSVAYIVVRFGENSVLVAPEDASMFDGQLVQPAEVGDRSTQVCYLTVANVDAHLARARTAGARIEAEPRDGDGGRFYTARDPEGHLWAFGHILAGTKSTLPDRPMFESPFTLPTRTSRVGLAAALLVGLTVGGAAMYLGSDLVPNALATRAYFPEMTSERSDLDRLNAMRLADAEAATIDLTDKLQAARQQYADALVQKRAVEERLSLAEAEFQSLKDRLGTMDATVRAKGAASQALEAERQRIQAIQTQLDEASKQLAGPRGEGDRGDTEIEQLRAMMVRLSNSLVASTRAADTARTQLAEAQQMQTALQEKLRTKENEAVELRAKVTILEADIDVAKVRTEQAARAARGAPAAKPDEMAPRDPSRVTEVGSLPDHHLTQGKKWVSVAAVNRVDSQGPAPAEPAAVPEDGAPSLCGQAVQELVFSSYRTSPATQGRVVKRLCDRSHTTQEPAKCLSLLLARKVSWGGSTEWKLKNAVDLCARTPSASTTITCFTRRIADGTNWEVAIAKCGAS